MGYFDLEIWADVVEEFSGIDYTMRVTQGEYRYVYICTVGSHKEILKTNDDLTVYEYERLGRKRLRLSSAGQARCSMTKQFATTESTYTAGDDGYAKILAKAERLIEKMRKDPIHDSRVLRVLPQPIGEAIEEHYSRV